MISKFKQKSICSACALLFLFNTSISLAQTEAAAEVSLQALTGSDLPFWMQHNTRGRILEKTNFLALASGKVVHQFSSGSRLEAGGGVFFEEQRGEALLDELYLEYQNDWLQAVAGKKQRSEFFYGLSATNEGILRSINARPLPGLEFSTSRPIFVLPQAGVGFEASWSEYFLEEDRHVNKARLHHKSFHLVYRLSAKFELKAGLEHYVQWAGTSASLGKQPSGFEDYLRIIIGHNGGEGASAGDLINALGNNLGSYEVSLKSQLGQYQVNLIYNTIFEDGSGMRLENVPDGRYALFVEDVEKNKLFHALMYEFYYTKHQSHTTKWEHKYDNYFSNGVYRSGWTYHGRIIGAPFFLPNEGKLGIENNIFTAHHLGIAGLLTENMPFRFLTSYRRNYGTSVTSYSYFTKDPAQEIFSSLFELQILLQNLQIKLQVGSDFANDNEPDFGAGVGLSYGF